MSESITDESLRTLLGAAHREPLEGLQETGDSWGLGNTVRIQKSRPTFSVGFGYDLLPWSGFDKRAFDVADLGLRGWAVVFQFFPPGLLPWPKAEYLAGWVPTERGADAEQWIAFLNDQIRDRLRQATKAVDAGAALKLIGNFRETGYDDVADAPSLVEARGLRGPAHKADVVAYLRRAPSVSCSPGPVEDHFDPSRSAGSFTMRTDGLYVWPEFLATYVERYDVRLPPDFEVHMATKAWQPPADLDVTKVKVPW